MLDALFPNGWLPYLLGGICIGTGTAIVYLATAIPAGASTFLGMFAGAYFQGRFRTALMDTTTTAEVRT